MKTKNYKEIVDAINENYQAEKEFGCGFYCEDYLVRGDTTYVVTYGAGELPTVWSEAGIPLFEENPGSIEDYLSEL